MKYTKPEIKFEKICAEKAISSNVNLGAWLEMGGYNADAENHITTYLVNS